MLWASGIPCGNANRGPCRDGEVFERPRRLAEHATRDDLDRFAVDGSGALVFPAEVL